MEEEPLREFNADDVDDVVGETQVQEWPGNDPMIGGGCDVEKLHVMPIYPKKAEDKCELEEDVVVDDGVDVPFEPTFTTRRTSDAHLITLYDEPEECPPPVVKVDSYYEDLTGKPSIDKTKVVTAVKRKFSETSSSPKTAKKQRTKKKFERYTVNDVWAKRQDSLYAKLAKAHKPGQFMVSSYTVLQSPVMYCR